MGNSSFPLTTDAAAGTCLTVSGNVVVPGPCVAGSASQTFAIGENGNTAAPGGDNAEVVPSTSAVVEVVVSSTSAVAEAPATGTEAPGCSGTGTTFVTITRDVTVTAPAGQTSAPAAAIPSTAAPIASTSVTQPPSPTIISATTTSSAAAAPPTATIQPPAAPVQGNPTEAVPVSRAGGTLNPTLAAEAHTFDAGATRAFTAVSIKDANGQCLFVDPTAGDFRQNLIPVAVRDCTGAAGEKFDLVTKGVHNNQEGKTLLVSSLMNGCVNLDIRRAAGDQVMVFSCGGRAAGEGNTTPDQLFSFTGGNQIVLEQVKQDDKKFCLVPSGGKLNSSENCDGGVATYTIG